MVLDESRCEAEGVDEIIENVTHFLGCRFDGR